ncbi:hypothetical protein R3W88_033534 [Solanum pinnatisectum]|uniref:Uncharacterized protein n=1 Tax=Solanum pinnatisectum TaxID=50273 RepID=A0AAV9K163_9SOLN|nr:hypothetical protein R3W88_033534 [Solanum pinnatisectum]
MNAVDSNKGLPTVPLKKPRRFIRNTDKEVTTASMELGKNVIVINNSFNALNEEQDEGEKNKRGGGGNEYKRVDYKFFLQKYKHRVMKSNNVLPSQEPKDLAKALEAEALDKALVIHKNHHVLHGDGLGGHDVVVLDMVEFEEDPILCSEEVVNMYISTNREKLLTCCSLGSQEQVHNVRSVREVHNAVVNFSGVIKQNQQQNGLVIDRDEVENQSDHAQVVNNAGGSPQGKSKKKKSKPQGEKYTRTNPMRFDRAMLK